MSFIEALAMALALGTDAFSVAMAIGTRQYRLMEIIKISLIIGIFHVFMPLLGYFGGELVQEFIYRYFPINNGLDYIFELIGAGILLLIGFYMIIESRMEEREIPEINSGSWGVLVVATGVSIDALSVGISLGMLGFGLAVVFLFGLVAALMMGSGLFLGTKIGHWLGNNAQVFGGLALIYIGFHFAGLI